MLRGGVRSLTGSALLAALLLAACGTTAAPPAAPAATATSPGGSRPETLPTVRLSYTAITPTSLPFLVAKDDGIFAQEQVNVTLQQFLQGGSIPADALTAGQVDIMSETAGPDTVLRLAQKGAKIKIIGAEQVLDPTWLYVKADVKGVADLKGRTVVIGALGGPLYTYGLLMLMSGGLQKTDVKLLQVGNNQQRLSLLSSGQADAAILSLPGNFTAEQQGFHQLVALGDILKSAVFLWVVNDNALQSKREGIVRFMRAIHKAQQMIQSDPARYAPYYAQLTKTSQDIALKSIQSYAPYYGWDVDMSQLLYVFDFDRKVGLWSGPMPTAADLQPLIDDSVLKEANSGGS